MVTNLTLAAPTPAAPRRVETPTRTAPTAPTSARTAPEPRTPRRPVDPGPAARQSTASSLPVLASAKAQPAPVDLAATGYGASGRGEGLSGSDPGVNPSMPRVDLQA